MKVRTCLYLDSCSFMTIGNCEKNKCNEITLRSNGVERVKYNIVKARQEQEW